MILQPTFLVPYGERPTSAVSVQRRHGGSIAGLLAAILVSGQAGGILPILISTLAGDSAGILSGFLHRWGSSGLTFEDISGEGCI